MLSRPFKIALVCSTLNHIGGPAAHMRNIYKNLNGNEFQLTLIFCSQNETALYDFLIDGGVDAKDIIFIPHQEKKIIIPFVFSLRDIFYQEQFDIVHAFETQTQVLAGWAAKLAGVKKFIGQCEAQFLPSTITYPKRMLFRTMNFFLKDYFTKTIAVSSGLQNELIKNKLRPPAKIQLIRLGIEAAEKRDSDFNYSGINKGVPIIGTVSRLSVEKGLDRFIQAIPYILKEFPASKFVIYGDGDKKEPLKKQARKLGILEKIEFRPWVKDVPHALRSLEVFVMPSFREGLPITLLEAMSVGRLCVASDIEGIREIIYNGVDGILVDTSNPQFFASAIISVCRSSEIATMGHAAADKVQNYFNVKREAQEIKRLYEEILAS